MVQIIQIPDSLFDTDVDTFISHMVQIIRRRKINSTRCVHRFISHMVQIIPKEHGFEVELDLSLYIPHGSDNTCVMKKYLKLFRHSSLYPTWFR